MDLNSRAFTEAVKSLSDVGLLDPQKLAVTPVSSLPEIAALAVEGWTHKISKEEMLTWLTMERNKAIPRRQMMQDEITKYEELHRYRLSLEGTKEEHKKVIFESQARCQEIKMSRQAAPGWISQSSKIQRTDARDRKSIDEANRIKWATESLKVLIEAGWAQPEIELGETGWNRMITRLKKGLRVRTLEARARSLQRIWRWAKIVNEGKWPDTSELLEDYMNDLSTRKEAGVSTFDRARYAYLYAEAAVGRLKSARIGDSESLKATIQELTLKIAEVKGRKKQQAPQLLSSIIKRWETYVVDEENPSYFRAYA